MKQQKGNDAKAKEAQDAAAAKVQESTKKAQEEAKAVWICARFVSSGSLDNLVVRS